MASYADCVRGRPQHCDYDPMSDEQELYVSVACRVEPKSTQTVWQHLVAHSTNPLNLTKASLDEKLPTGCCRSYATFLLCKGHNIVQVDQMVVWQEAKYLQNYATIVCFIGGKLPEYHMRNWIRLLQNAVQGLVTLGCTLGKGFLL